MSKALRAQQEALETLWQKGLSGHELLQRHTKLVDAFIIEQFDNSTAVHNNKGQLAVIALGGYGRCELYPYSDVDLLLLHDWRSGKCMQDVSESILYPLWDAGFDVGHSVRGVKDAVRFAGEDFIFQVSLLDARFLTGSESLHKKLLSRYRKKVLDGHRRDFVQIMEEMRGQRRSRYGSHSYLLEPHIKEGKGGMRDIQAMLWTAKAVFGLSGMAAMEEAGMLEADARHDFENSWDMLARIRNRLHYISRRHNDQLIFEYQEEMAAAFGYQDRDGMLAVEHFMRHVYRHLQTIALVTDLFFEQVHEVLGLSGKGKKEKEVERGIVVRSDTLRLTVTEQELAKRSYLLLRIFLQAVRSELPIHHRSRQMVTRNLHLVDDHFQTSRRNARIFIDLLLQDNNPMAALEAMLETGLLPAYIPEFGGIESLAQHDLYHIYTVDHHQLQAVAELHGLRKQEVALFMGLSSPHLLFLAALVHDIGKGRHADHSVLGAEMVDAVGVRLGLGKEERACLAFLIRYHLYLPENALRRDLEDQEFIQQAAELIGDIDRLTMLYLLTIADSKATGPSAWSDWKATLLAELYLKVKSCLEEECVLDAEDGEGLVQGVSWLRQQILGCLGGEQGMRMDVHELPEDYLMSFTPEMVVQHLRLHRDQAKQLQQRTLLFPQARRGYWSMLMLSRDRQGLLAKLCGVLALHNLSVLAAQIFTWPDGTVVDVLDLQPTVGSNFEEQDWQALEADLNRALNYRLDIGLQLHGKKHSFGLGAKRQVQQIERKVVLDNDASNKFTVIEVYGKDAPGTLYYLAQTISDFGLDIFRAKIATEVEQLIDIFYVLDRDGRKVVDQALLDKIEQALLGTMQVDEN